MTTLSPGSKAPDIQTNGFHLREALAAGPVVVAFFKVECPTCQYTFPYLERLHRAYPGHVIGISQNGRADTDSFARVYGITFPLELDPAGKYPASNAYGITNVPSLFLIASDGTIELAGAGWVKAEMEALSTALAAGTKRAPAVLFKPREEIAAFKAG